MGQALAQAAAALECDAAAADRELAREQLDSLTEDIAKLRSVV
ncbi:MAG: hypothetical protein ACK40O_00920 [Allosphingosinicella sp.]